MPVLDFKEIPQPNLANGKQDTFELFSRDFFEMLGFKVESGPDRGQDDGRDIIICEERKGIVGITEKKWLVSCKHKSHSGSSVQLNDENDVVDRVHHHNCSGFIGFYSTVMSSSLGRKLDRFKNDFEILVFDQEKIESQLLKSKEGIELIRRYFADSYLVWQRSSEVTSGPTNLFTNYTPLECHCCGKDLLESKFGIIAFVEDPEPTDGEVIDIYWSCKKECDNKLEGLYRSQGYITKWEELTDLFIPANYLRWNMAIMNRIRDEDDTYTDEAYLKLRDFIVIVGQMVFRRQSEQQIAWLKELLSLPDYV